jgi:2-isopropylmalate synthase
LQKWLARRHSAGNDDQDAWAEVLGSCADRAGGIGCWPNRVITQPPLWCSTDLRDGNQALIEPMDQPRKLRMFETLIRIGFKEIEIGFPAASQVEFDFVRRLIDEDRIPPDVIVQVLTQARPEQIERAFASLRGARQAVVHVYNATAPVFRRVVFQKDRAGVLEIATRATAQIRDLAAADARTDWGFEYSPETFSATELEFSKEICDAVVELGGDPAAQGDREPARHGRALDGPTSTPTRSSGCTATWRGETPSC